MTKRTQTEEYKRLCDAWDSKFSKPPHPDSYVYRLYLAIREAITERKEELAEYYGIEDCFIDVREDERLNAFSIDVREEEAGVFDVECDFFKNSNMLVIPYDDEESLQKIFDLDEIKILKIAYSMVFLGHIKNSSVKWKQTESDIDLKTWKMKFAKADAISNDLRVSCDTFLIKARKADFLEKLTYVAQQAKQRLRPMGFRSIRVKDPLKKIHSIAIYRSSSDHVSVVWYLEEDSADGLELDIYFSSVIDIRYQLEPDTLAKCVDISLKHLISVFQYALDFGNETRG